MLGWAVGQGPAGLAGVISVGGRPFLGFEHDPPRFALWATAGHEDPNYVPTLRLVELAQATASAPVRELSGNPADAARHLPGFPDIPDLRGRESAR